MRDEAAAHGNGDLCARRPAWSWRKAGRCGRGRTRRGRPRSIETTNAILESSYALMATTGLAATTIDAVARHSNVSKMTIYKWWPSREALLIDAFLHHAGANAAAAPRECGHARGARVAAPRRGLCRSLAGRVRQGAACGHLRMHLEDRLGGAVLCPLPAVPPRDSAGGNDRDRPA